MPNPSASVRLRARERDPRAPSVRQAVLDEGPQRRKPIPPGDLLALAVIPTLVSDRHLVDPRPPLEELGRDLGLDPEAVTLEVDALQDVRPHRLEAGLHVRHPRGVED